MRLAVCRIEGRTADRHVSPVAAITTEPKGTERNSIHLSLALLRSLSQKNIKKPRTFPPQNRRPVLAPCAVPCRGFGFWFSRVCFSVSELGNDHGNHPDRSQKKKKPTRKPKKRIPCDRERDNSYGFTGEQRVVSRQTETVSPEHRVPPPLRMMLLLLLLLHTAVLQREFWFDGASSGRTHSAVLFCHKNKRQRKLRL